MIPLLCESFTNVEHREKFVNTKISRLFKIRDDVIIGHMFISIRLLIPMVVLIAVYFCWSVLFIIDRNPLPFPDRGSRIFAAPSLEAKNAIVELLARHGIAERFQVNTDGVNRSIMWDGTIINNSSPEVNKKLGTPAASIGLVVNDPAASAAAAAEFLKSKGFKAEIVSDAEPELPIVFVITDAMSGTVLNFRKHVIHMPRPK
jgi:hypothetical protein